jgi:hypothetical protein
MQQTFGNQAVQRLVIQRSPGFEERKQLVAEIISAIVAYLRKNERSRETPSLATLSSRTISRGLAKTLTLQKAEGRDPREWQFLGVGVKPPAASEATPGATETEQGSDGAPFEFKGEAGPPGMDVEQGSDGAPFEFKGEAGPPGMDVEQGSDGAPFEFKGEAPAMETEQPVPGANPLIADTPAPTTPRGRKRPANLPSFVELTWEQTPEGMRPSVRYKPNKRPRIVYSTNPGSGIGFKTEAIKSFENNEWDKLLAHGKTQTEEKEKEKEKEKSDDQPREPQKRAKTPRNTTKRKSRGRKSRKSKSKDSLPEESKARLEASVMEKLQADEFARLSREFHLADRTAEAERIYPLDMLLPKNILSLQPELKFQGKKASGETFHTETRLTFEGCEHVTVSGPPSSNPAAAEGWEFGKSYNCIFCSLYNLAHGIPYKFHADKVKGWYLPEHVSIDDFFGPVVAELVKSEKFQHEFPEVGTSTQKLIDALTNGNLPWPKTGFGQSERKKRD